jgi:hypothetical protein
MTASAEYPLPTPPSPPPSPPKGHVARNWTIAVVVIIGLIVIGLFVLGAMAKNNVDSKGNAFGDVTLGSCHHQENARGLVECMITIHNSSSGRAGYVIEAQALRGNTVVGGLIHTIVLEVPRGGTKETTLGGVVDGQWDSVRIISVHRDSVPMTNA